MRGTEGDLGKLEHPIEGSDQTYPLIGSGSTDEVRQPQARSWSVRAVLHTEYRAEEMSVLRDSVAQILKADDLVREDAEYLPSHLKAEKRGTEGRVWPDQNFLRTIAEVRRLKAQFTELESWTAVSEGSLREDPENLVGETLRQLSAVLAGCHSLEFVQAKDESFQSFWSRLSVSFLMAAEADLQAFEDPISGASFFSDLVERLDTQV